MYLPAPTSLLGSISGPPVDDSWSYRDTGCERTADGLSLSAWNSLPDNLRDSSVSRDSFCKLLKSYLFTRYWNIERIRGFTRMRYTNLLRPTYLLTYLRGNPAQTQTIKIRYRIPNFFRVTRNHPNRTPSMLSSFRPSGFGPASLPPRFASSHKILDPPLCVNSKTE